MIVSTEGVPLKGDTRRLFKHKLAICFTSRVICVRTLYMHCASGLSEFETKGGFGQIYFLQYFTVGLDNKMMLHRFIAM